MLMNLHGNCYLTEEMEIKMIKRKRANGTGTIHMLGYVLISVHGKQYYEHILVAEKALGKPLPPGAEVHHLDENRRNNKPNNLVICPSRAYHKLLHMRMRQLKAAQAVKEILWTLASSQ